MSTDRKALRRAIAAALLLGPAAMHAAPGAGEYEVLEEVVVVAKRRTPLQHAAAVVTVIDRQQIARTLSQDIRDLVRYEPGVAVRNDPVRFGLDSFAIRGVSGDRVAAEIDGVSVAESFAVGALADSGRTFVDLDFIERVEILRGPASALYGSDAIGGVVRFETLDPEDLLQPQQRLATHVRAGYRGDTDGWSTTLLGAASSEAAELLLGYVHRDNHEAEIAGGPTPNPRASRSDQALAKLVAPNAAFGPLEIALEAGRTRDQTTVNALLGAPPRFINTVAMSGDDTAEHARLSIEQTLAPGGAWMDEAVWRVYVQRTVVEQITDERRRAAPPRSPPTELRRIFTLEDELAGAEMTASKAFAAGSWSHQLVYGVELEAGRVTQERDGHERNLTTGVVSPVILGEVFPVRDFPITRRIEAGVYMQDELRPANSRWRITPGLRFDLYRLRPREDGMYREDNPSARPVELSEQALAPKLALSYAVADSLSAFAQYARGFRSPPFEDVNIGLEIPLFNYRAVPNPDLKPETSDGFEIGLRARRSAWRATGSAYYTRFEDLIESRVNLGRDPVSGVTLFQSRNIERARIYGVELATQLDAGELAPAWRGWSLALNAAWVRGDDLGADRPLNSVDPLKATLTIDYNAPARWGARVAATAVAAKDRLNEDATALFRTDGYLVLDAYLYFELGERGLLNVGVGNLTNERYIDWIDVRGRAADDPLVQYAAHPGRNAAATVGWKF